MALLPAYVLIGTVARARGLFNSITTSGINTRGVANGISASATQTLAGATALATEINIVTTVAAAGNAVKLPALLPGQSLDVYNNGANAMAVFPAAAGVTIDGGAAGASVTLSSGKRARFTCIVANAVISSQFGAASA